MEVIMSEQQFPLINEFPGLFSFHYHGVIKITCDNINGWQTTDKIIGLKEKPFRLSYV